MESKLLSILHNDDVDKLKILMKDSNKVWHASEILLLRLAKPAAEDPLDSTGPSQLSLLDRQSTVLEVAFCTLAINCLSELLNYQDESVDLLSSTCPLHCLIYQLSVVPTDSDRESAAVHFLEELLTRTHNDFFLRCCDAEADGYNALEWAVICKQLRIADWILRSSRYTTSTYMAIGVQEYSLDLTDYSFPWGDRLYKNPLNSLAEIVAEDLQVSQTAKDFLDSGATARWTRHLLDKYRVPIAGKIVAIFLFKCILLLFGTINIYRTMYFGSSFLEALNRSATHNCAMLQIFHVFSSSECVTLSVRALSFVAFTVVCADAFIVFFAVSMYLMVARCGISTWKRFLSNTLVESNFSQSIAAVLINIVTLKYYLANLSKPMDSVPSTFGEDFWKSSAASRSEIYFIDILVFVSCWVTLFTTIYDWTLVADHMCLVWKTGIVFSGFMVVIFIVIILSSWIVAAIIPCEQSFNHESQSSLISIWTAVYESLVFSTMSQHSYERLGAFSMLLHMLINLFFFNFLIAAMADRMSKISDNLRYIALANRLSAFFVVEYSIAMVARIFFKKKKRRSRWILTFVQK